MAAVSTETRLPTFMAHNQQSCSECRPLTVSATFFQPRNSQDEKSEEEEEEEEEIVQLNRKIIQVTVIHREGPGSRDGAGQVSGSRDDASVTATVVRSRSTSVLVVHDEEETPVEESIVHETVDIDFQGENGEMAGIVMEGSDEDGSSGGKGEEESPEDDGSNGRLNPASRTVEMKISRSQELEPDELVSKIAEYERISTVGTGSFGRVILVRHQLSGRYYALKVMGIREVIRNRQIEHVHSEKNILLSVDHPFIVKLHWAYHDTKFLYMLFDYVPGGELFSYLRCVRRFSNYVAQFYTSQVVLALEYLHNVHVVYRDLKPENILLDQNGHIRLTDFGFAKMLTEGRTWSMVGTPEYMAPEIITGGGHNSAVDWWSLGILIYEMLVGRTPFPGKESNEVYRRIMERKARFPKGLDPDAKHLIKKFLVINRVKRLGNLKGGAADVKAHIWFADVDWDAVYEKKVQPPIKPTVNGEGDTGNFDEYDEDDLSQVSEGTKDDLELFEDW